MQPKQNQKNSKIPYTTSYHDKDKDKAKLTTITTNTVEEGTTEKLVNLILRMTSRLDDIEKQLGNLPNHS